MRILPFVALALTVAVVFSAAQNQTSKSTINPSNKNASVKKNRGPIFRASSDQIKQAQSILKQRTFYAGEQTGKLDTDTRAALKKYQQSEGLKVTGTLNKLTLEKMGIELSEKQKTM